VGRHRLQRSEGGKRNQVITTGLLRQRDDARLAIARCSRRIERDVTIRRSRSKNEEVDSPGLGDSLIIFAGILRIRKPDRLISNAVLLREMLIPSIHHLCPDKM